MGKGNRNRNDRYEDVYSMSGTSGAAVKPARKSGGAKKDRTSTLLITVIAILLLAAFAIFIFADSGIMERNTTYVSSDNYKVTGTMLPYYESLAYSNNFQQWYYYYYFYQYSGNATSAYNAASQMMANYTLASFFDSAVATAKDIVALCEAAHTAGVTLDDEDKKSIDDTLAEITDTSSMGSGVKKSDIRKAIELQTLASKYAQIITDDIESKITDDDIKKYVEEHKSSYYSADYLKYNLLLNASDYTDDKVGYAAAEKLADEYFKKLSDAKNEEEFKKLIIEYEINKSFDAMIEKNKGDLATPDEATANAAKAAIIEDVFKVCVDGEKAAESFTDNETYKTMFKSIAQGFVNTCGESLGKITENAKYSESESEEDEISKWLSSSETKKGDTHTKEDSTDKQYSKTVYLMTETMHLDTSATKDFAHILIKAAKDTAKEEEIAAAKEKAEKVLAEYKAGEQTLDAFKKLAETYNEDGNCLYENTTEGRMVTVMNDWIFDADRKVGDVEILQSEYGFHVTYFVGEGKAPYYTEATEAYSSEKYDEQLKELTEKYVTTNDKAISKHTKDTTTSAN